MMPARNPRVNVVLDRALCDAVAHLARRAGISVSSQVRDLVARALETEEDVALEGLAECRERTFNRGRALSHPQIWKKILFGKDEEHTRS